MPFKMASRLFFSRMEVALGCTESFLDDKSSWAVSDLHEAIEVSLGPDKISNAVKSRCWRLPWISPVAFSAGLQLCFAFWSEQRNGWTRARIFGSITALLAIVARVHFRRGCRALSACCAYILLTEFASPVVWCVGAVSAWWFPSFPARDDALEALEMFQRENGRLPKRTNIPARKPENNLSWRFHHLLRVRDQLTNVQHARLKRLEQDNLDHAVAESTTGAQSSNDRATTTGGQAGVSDGNISLRKVPRRLRRKTSSFVVSEMMCAAVPDARLPVALAEAADISCVNLVAPGGVAGVQMDAAVAPRTVVEVTSPQMPQVHPSSSSSYFEIQVDAWCGMHALNNFLGGPYVTKDACERAAVQVARRLSEAGVGDAEELSEHLDRGTGFLSIDVINVLGASVLGIHVEGDAISWRQLQECDPGAAAFVNWNNHHWTVLRQDVESGEWVHMNSILGDAVRHGRKACDTEHSVLTILAEIQQAYGGVTLHRVTMADTHAGPHFLEAESRVAMLGVQDAEATADNIGGACEEAAVSDELVVVTVNVDGLGSYAASSSSRMEAIITLILATSPDVLMLQEVVADMYVVVRRLLPSWKVFRKSQLDEDYFNVMALRDGAEKRLLTRSSVQTMVGIFS